MYRYNNPVHRILDALELLTEPGQTDQLLVEACNHLFSQLGEDFLKTIPKTTYSYSSGANGWQNIDALQVFLKAIKLEGVKDNVVEGVWKLYHWRQYSGTPENIDKTYPPLMIFCRAYELGVIGRADMIRGLTTPDSFSVLSSKKKHARQFNYFFEVFFSEGFVYAEPGPFTGYRTEKR